MCMALDYGQHLYKTIRGISAAILAQRTEVRLYQRRIVQISFIRQTANKPDDLCIYALDDCVRQGGGREGVGRSW